MTRNQQLKSGMKHGNQMCVLLSVMLTSNDCASWAQKRALNGCFVIWDYRFMNRRISISRKYHFSLSLLPAYQSVCLPVCLPACLSVCPPFIVLSGVKQTIHWVRAFTYGAISSSLNSRNGKSTPTTATEQFSFVIFCITLPFFASLPNRPARSPSTHPARC